MDSPICGMITSTPAPPPAAGAARLAGAGCDAWGLAPPLAGLAVAGPSVEAAPPFVAPAVLAGSGALVAGAAVEAAAPSASITPTTVFTCTVVPSETFT